MAHASMSAGLARMEGQFPTISFHTCSECPGWDKAPNWILSLIERFGSQNILEIGAGANPTLSASIVSSRDLQYSLNDVDAEELDKADTRFSRWVGDLTRDDIPAHLEGKFDLVFSRMVTEHVPDGRAYHSNIRRLLVPGGIAAHCFPTLYALPFLANRLLPERVSSLILGLCNPRDRYKQGKFRAYYSWSRGPSRRTIARIESLGYEVIEYRGYFGHGYYWRWRILHNLELRKARLLTRNPVPALCSYAMLLARKRP
jgi:SAM-dependent methyltransferase